MKKILFVINESEKERILDMHKSASKRHYLSEKSSAFKTLNEQFNPTNGIYTTKNDQSLMSSIDFNTQHPNKIPAGTKIYHDYNNKSNTKIIIGNTGVVAYCDRNLFTYNDSITDLKNDGFMNVIKSVFCNGNKLKTWDQLTNKVVKDKVKTITGGGGSLSGTTEISGTTGTTSNLKTTEFPEIKITPQKLQGVTGTTVTSGATGSVPPLQGVVDTTNMASRSDIRQGYRQGKRDVRELEKELRQTQNTLQRLSNKMTPEQKKQYETKIAQLQIQINQSAR
jgi:hypothetical protein